MVAQHGAPTAGVRREGGTGRQAAGGAGCILAVLALFAAAMLPVAQAAPADGPTRGTVWADLAAAREAAGRDGKPILTLALRPGDVAGMDCRHWLEDAAVAATVSRFHPVLLPPSAQAAASGLFPDPQAASPWDNQSRFASGSRLAFLTPGGKGIAVVPVPPTRRALPPLLEGILADPRPLDAVAAAAAASPKDAALVDRALERLRQAGQVGPALALTRAVVTAAPEAVRPRRQAEADELAITAADLLAGGFARLAGRLAELAKSAPAGSTRLEALRPLLPSLDGGLPGATGAFPEAVARARKLLDEAATEENAAKVVAELAPVVKTRADELRRQAADLRKSYAAAHPEDLRAQLWRLRNALDNENDNRPGSESEARKLLAGLLARPMSAEESLTAAGSLAEIVLRLDLPAERGQVVAKLEREAPVGRGAAEALLDLADEALAQGARDEAERCWRLALAASDGGESPTFHHAARVAQGIALGKETPAGALWAGRRVLDVVVLVRDLESFAAAIARWTDKEFFPVLFADDLYAPRFVAAFRPAHVVLLPPRPGSAPGAPLSAERLRAAVLAAWSADAAPTAATPPEDLHAHLRALRITPPGIVVGDGVSGETAGALALAAGRFQGFEILPVPRIGEGEKARPALPADHLSEEAASELAAGLYESLGRWGALPEDGWSAVTLAGAYPYRYTGEAFGQWGRTYALDDLVGRAPDGRRVAVSGRLLGDAARSAYQAACSLFLQPENACLFNTYGTNPASIWGHYRMDFSEAALGPLLAVTHDRNKEASIEGFRKRTAPWNPYALLTINSSGGATSWSVAGGGGTPDDFPVGIPSAIHITHSGSAADPYNNDTLAGRALWGGTFWYYGSTAEPFLSSFQPPRTYAPRLAAGAPFAAAFRQRPGQQFWRPWRLMLVGDPLFSLRRAPAARASYRPGGDPLVAAGEVLLRAPQAGAAKDVASPAERYTAWLDGLRQARWRGDRATAHALAERLPEGCTLDGPGLAMALEEDLLAGRAADAAQRWAAAPDASREEYAARIHARQAIGSLMDVALAAKDLGELRRLLPELLSTRLAGNTVQRWLGKLGGLAKEKGETAAHAEWLRPLAADPRWKAYAGPLAAALKAAAP